MTRINPAVAPDLALEWIQKNQKQINTHPAWHGNISEKDSEILLNNEGSFIYLLRSGEKRHSYFISFVKKDGSIQHQSFTLELDQKGWQYRNGSTINYNDLNKLIPLMMHCDPASCNPLRVLN
ncbi:MAG: SH2 domain-containing protein [Rhabdochlamydiaceae bacterium]